MIIDQAVEIKTHTSMNISNISQRLALATFDLNDDYLEKSRKKWSERREYLYKKLVNLKQNLVKLEGAFFIFVPFVHGSRVVYDFSMGNGLA